MGMTVIDEQQPLLGQANGSERQDCLERGERQHEMQTASSWKEWTAEKLEAPSTHKAVILLITIDACCVLADLSYTFLSSERDCAHPATGASYAYVLSPGPDSGLGLTLLHTLEENQPTWLTILSHISLTITTLFLLEIPLALWCFGLNYYNPFSKSSQGQGDRSENENPYAALHLFDAFVVLTTFVLEVVLRGREAELAGLLILLRLWRLVKLVGGLAKGAGELQEELSNKLEETEHLLQEERARVQKLEEENAQLRARIADTDASVDDT